MRKPGDPGTMILTFSVPVYVEYDPRKNEVVRVVVDDESTQRHFDGVGWDEDGMPRVVWYPEQVLETIETVEWPHWQFGW